MASGLERIPCSDSRLARGEDDRANWLTRSYLAVPAHRERLVQNAAASQADAVFLDLEDAVPPAEKAAALETAASALTTLDWGHKMGRGPAECDRQRTMEARSGGSAGIARLDAFIVPKAEKTADIAKMASWISAAAGNRAKPAEMELLIETARGLVNVETLAASDRCVSALASRRRRFRGLDRRTQH